MEMDARCFNCLAPFRMAISPPELVAEEDAQQHAGQSGEQAPRPHHADDAPQCALVSIVECLRDALHRTHGDAEVGGVGKQVDGGVEKRNQTHSCGPKNRCDKFIAHDAHQNVHTLHSAKQARVLEYMGITIGLLRLFHV